MSVPKIAKYLFLTPGDPSYLVCSKNCTMFINCKMFISNAMPGDPSYWVCSKNCTEGTPLIGSVPKIAQCSSVTPLSVTLDLTLLVCSKNCTEGTPLIGSLVPKIALCSSVTLDSNVRSPGLNVRSPRLNLSYWVGSKNCTMFVRNATVSNAGSHSYSFVSKNA